MECEFLEEAFILGLSVGSLFMIIVTMILSGLRNTSDDKMDQLVQESASNSDKIDKIINLIDTKLDVKSQVTKPDTADVEPKSPERSSESTFGRSPELYTDDSPMEAIIRTMKAMKAMKAMKSPENSDVISVVDTNDLVDMMKKIPQGPTPEFPTGDNLIKNLMDGAKNVKDELSRQGKLPANKNPEGFDKFVKEIMKDKDTKNMLLETAMSVLFGKPANGNIRVSQDQNLAEVHAIGKKEKVIITDADDDDPSLGDSKHRFEDVDDALTVELDNIFKEEIKDRVDPVIDTSIVSKPIVDKPSTPDVNYPPSFHVSKSGGYMTLGDMENIGTQYGMKKNEEREIMNKFSPIVGMTFDAALQHVGVQGYGLRVLYVGMGPKIDKYPEHSRSDKILGVRISDPNFDYTTRTTSPGAVITEIIDVGGIDRYDRGTIRI
jgi:hypothetical protein